MTTPDDADAEPVGVYVVALTGADGESATLTARQAPDRRCELTCAYRGAATRATAWDFFEALCVIRETLAREGLGLHCYGASLNVWPSGMARDMGRGLSAYRMTMGRQAGLDDLVGIFDAGADVTVASVDAQKQFALDWRASLRRSTA